MGAAPEKGNLSFAYTDVEFNMKTPGKSINRYMDYAYSWIGWGHHGARTSYAHDYASRLITVEV